MYQGYQDWTELEDELYKEEDSEGSEDNSDLEFQLYSQLHYSSIARELEDGGELEEGTEEEGKVEVGPQLEVMERTGDGNGEQNGLEENLSVSHDEGGLRKHDKKHAELHEKKRKKQKKQKVQGDDDEERRSFSSAFKGVIKEVIVIDSSPEDISISETDTDDDGVCILKGGTSNSRPLQTSTPSQLTHQKRKSNPSLQSIVVLDSEDSAVESESDSEPSGSVSDSDSDSDGLENWMILGSGKQDGDHSISLNLEGEAAYSTDDDGDGDGGGLSWSVSNKDREAQIRNKDAGPRFQLGNRGASRYFVDKKVTCHNCNKTGHLSKNCPLPKKVPPCFLCGSIGHLSHHCPKKHCNNCGLPGHLYESCSEMAYWHKQCHRCGVTGHYLDACPEIWRQYHITPKAGPPVRHKGNDPGRNPPYCYNCSRRGHFGHACKMQRMYRGTFANTPFINHYDTKDDIKRRNNRIKFKHLNVSGQLSTPRTPETPGPPKKRQKTNHQDPYRHSNHHSHQSPFIHKSSNSHIRFNDGHKSATKFNPKKADKQRQQGSCGPGKRWEPKREVPTTREPLPPARPAKVVFDQTDDFPRGKGEGEKKRKKMNKNSSKGPPGVSFKSNACTSDRLFGAARGGEAKKKSRARGRDRKKAAATEMYPTDENLFIIKQRKGKGKAR